MIDASLFIEDCHAVREQSPLVLNIANPVAMNFTANALLAAGASPLMSSSADEAGELVEICSSLVVNIGCVDSVQAECMRLSASAAGLLGKRWILDPAGAGASRFRTRTALSLIRDYAPSVIRGNASEILSLCGRSISSRGVDSSFVEPGEAEEAARFLAKKNGVVVSVSGPVDIITDGDKVETIANGSPLMPRVTAMGCAASALTGAFLAVDPDAFSAALNAMAVMGVVGERAAALCSGTGSLAVLFLDMLSNLDPEEAAGQIRHQDIQ